MKFFKVRNDEGTVIAQYGRKSPPSEPENYTGLWNVEEVDISDLNSETVEWWDE